MIITRSSLAHHPRRRRHRSAVLLPRARRLSDRRRHRQVRLHHAASSRSSRGIYLKYSKIEQVEAVDEVQHPHRPRGAASCFRPSAGQIEITSWPTFRPAPAWARPAASPPRCCKALHAQTRNIIHPRELAEQACHIEIDLLEGADRQAGPVHRGLRRHHLLHLPPRRHGRRRAADARRGHPQPWKTIC